MKNAIWLGSAVALFGAGALVMTWNDPAAAERERFARLEFPTHARPAEATRMDARRTLAVAPAAGALAKAAPRALDPLLVALAAPADVAMVLEAGTVLRTPLGERLLGCMSEHERGRIEAKMNEQGVRWLDVVDRVAVSRATGSDDTVFIVSGKLAGIDWSKVFVDATTARHPSGAVTFTMGDHHAAVWNDSLLLFSKTMEALDVRLNRLREGGVDLPLAFAETEEYGEAYGVVGKHALARLAPEELRERIETDAAKAVIHVDARDDVLLVADVEGADPKAIEDLGKSLGAALAVARLKAKSEGLDHVVRLLDASRVRPFSGALRAEVAIPTALVEEHLANCGAREK